MIVNKSTYSSSIELRCALYALLFLLAALFFLDLPTISGSSEAREAQIASVIVNSGEWLYPTRNGLVASKPPLYHWFTAILATFFQLPVSAWLARLVSLLFASGTLYLTGLIAAAVVAQKSKQIQLKQASLAIIILGTSYGFYHMALLAMVDMCFTFFVVAALWVLLRRLLSWYPDDTIRLGDFVAYFLLCALATLAKGPLGLLLPSLIVYLVAVYFRGWRSASTLFFKPTWGWLMYVALACPWYLCAVLGERSELVNRQIGFENLARAFGGENIRSGPIWFYFPAFLRTAFPWSAVLIAALCIKRKRSTGFVVGMIWFLAGFVGFSLAVGKRDSYLLPLFPGIALALSSWLLENFESIHPRLTAFWQRIRNGYPTFLIVMACIVAMTIELFHLPLLDTHEGFRQVQRWIDLHAVSLHAFLAGLVAIVIFVYAKARFRYARPFVGWWAGLALLFCIVQIGYGIKAALKNYEQITEQITTHTGIASSVGVVRDQYEEFFDPMLYYLRRPVTLFKNEQQQFSGVQFLIARRSWVQLQNLDRLHLREIDSFVFSADVKKDRFDREIVLFQVER